MDFLDNRDSELPGRHSRARPDGALDSAGDDTDIEMAQSSNVDVTLSSPERR